MQEWTVEWFRDLKSGVWTLNNTLHARPEVHCRPDYSPPYRVEKRKAKVIIGSENKTSFLDLQTIFMQFSHIYASPRVLT